MAKLDIGEAKTTLLKEWFEGQAEIIAQDWDTFGTPEVQDLPHKSCDGFHCRINGGFQIRGWSSLYAAEGSGCIPKAIEPYLESAHRDAFNDWKAEAFGGPQRRSTDRLRRSQDTIEDITWDDLDEGEQEAASEYEWEYLNEGGDFWFVIRATFYAADNFRNESGEDEVHFLAGVNTDFTHGRDKGLEIDFSHNVPVAKLDAAILHTIAFDISQRLGQ